MTLPLPRSLGAKLTTVSMVLFLLVALAGFFTATEALHDVAWRSFAENKLRAARVTAQLTKETFPDFAFDINAEGQVINATWAAIPEFRDHVLVDEAKVLLGSELPVLRWDPAREDFFCLTTSFHDTKGNGYDGTPLGKDHPARSVILPGQPYHGRAEMFGASFVVALIPIKDVSGAVIGILCNFIPESVLMAGIAEGQREFAAGLIAAMIVGLITLILFNRQLLKPLAGLQGVMDRLRQGQMDGDVPALDRLDEIGGFARGIDAWRNSLLETKTLAAHNQQRQDEQQRVVQPLSSGLQSLAAGDLTHTLTTPFAADYQTLRDDFNKTLETLHITITRVVGVSENIRGKSDEINSASENLSSRTENQAAALKETAAALDQLTASVRSAADGAKKVERIVAQARREAEESFRVVQGAVNAMNEIEKSSVHISQIIGVIDDIAFQTNLLALNAGVEAARAGEAGRGFAVVASEVRALAQRSSEAANEIKTLISTSTKEVSRGVDQVGRAGEALRVIIGRVAQISTLVSEIAASAVEQSTGLAEINIVVSQLDQVTQQNAAMVEESTAASQTLHDESTSLAEIVSIFASSQARMRGSAAANHDAHQTAAAFKARPRAATGTGRMTAWEDF